GECREDQCDGPHPFRTRDDVEWFAQCLAAELSGLAGAPSGTSEGGRFFARAESAAARCLAARSTARSRPAAFTFHAYFWRSTASTGAGTSTKRTCCVMSLSR